VKKKASKHLIGSRGRRRVNVNKKKKKEKSRNTTTHYGFFH
jgi:hypothetical protein